MYKFRPILKTLVWGTENWVLSGVPGSESVVAEGPAAGRTLSEVYGGEFPLLIKFIAWMDLDAQVPPGVDELYQQGKLPSIDFGQSPAGLRTLGNDGLGAGHT